MFDNLFSNFAASNVMMKHIDVHKKEELQFTLFNEIMENITISNNRQIFKISGFEIFSLSNSKLTNICAVA